jgi:excinuclease ABC subunit A
VEKFLTEKQKAISRDIIKQITSRLYFLIQVGLSYLTLDRPASTLSGGESQRIRLATQLGSNLVNVLYILDEPSIGLHPRDNLRLIKALKDLTNQQNTVIVVEHDDQIMKLADYIIDLGPGAGPNGGHVVAQGTPEQFLKSNSLTAQYLSGSKKIPVPLKRRKGSGKFITIYGAKGNNLKNITVSFPLNTFICITGVSGSGKSSLINDTLYPALAQKLHHAKIQPLPFDDIQVPKEVKKVVVIDQQPIGKTPRSVPATYTKIFDQIRKIFAQTPAAKIRGYTPGRFSFNIKGGRCETCKGTGVQIIEMKLLPDVYVTCPDCNGSRYNRQTLEIRFKGKTIADVLDMTVEQALDFFQNFPSITHTLQAMYDVGLGYLKLGQSSTTLSGGEAQRVKLAAELSKKASSHTLYILDEPTTGMHFEDINKLLKVLHKLVDKGNTVIVIEHNMEIIKNADWIIDLGPEGGDKGGQIICSGTPEQIINCKNSYTAEFLAQYLQ